ncbi:type II toxin-antitoxin system RelE/ParE family toxin [Falsiroseomonas selenitidurans]|uniref:Type II toxin-antitoxin system RelE/ParE family toxin n=1 Tax=Falsiroseomonas selenitidurans TaxID=2716335 RepID=A0ABX1E5J4_9PROT|nr:type II toxin-antitoxin system RelE/ParE family toxin [Falsiroseomonas selenitidurans]NKC30205.1 type II toxin-antitoxin system RelE/ParE family toxin [Falsiroseomonas selenitidurans]
MHTMRRTAAFEAWLDGLKDSSAKARVLVRIDRMQNGNFGDWKSVGDGVSELRITYGPGYRVYFTQRGAVLVVLLGGGTKARQSRDIAAAKAVAAGLEE